LKIDIFSHISTLEYKNAISKINLLEPKVQERAILFGTTLSNLDARFEWMDKFENYVNVLTFAEPPIELIPDLKKAEELAKIANNSMAELVVKYPDKFIAAVASLPMNNMDATLKEVDRAIKELKMRGVQIYSNVNGKPLDSPEFLPLYEKMAQYDLPIWIHPARGQDHADYKTETRTFYGAVGLYGWPHETSVAMARLACSGVLEKYPNLKFITHHCGGTVPYLAGRVSELGSRSRITDEAKVKKLTKEPIDYLKMFYGDTAIYGEVPALMCGYYFFGPEHMLFGTDMPLGSISKPGIAGLEAAIKGIDQMPISDSDRKKIYEGNAKRLLHLA
jgi:predicted TIM-barrel fold metal-dependent hydrolase